jgi:hypothetical protein
MTRHAWAIVWGTLMLAIVLLGIAMYASESFAEWMWG